MVINRPTIADMPRGEQQRGLAPFERGQLPLDDFLAGIAVTTIFLARLLLLDEVDYRLRVGERVGRRMKDRVGDRIGRLLATLRRRGRQWSTPPLPMLGCAAIPVGTSTAVVGLAAASAGGAVLGKVDGGGGKFRGNDLFGRHLNYFSSESWLNHQYKDSKPGNEKSRDETEHSVQTRLLSIKLDRPLVAVLTSSGDGTLAVRWLQAAANPLARILLHGDAGSKQPTKSAARFRPIAGRFPMSPAKMGRSSPGDCLPLFEELNPCVTFFMNRIESIHPS